MTAPGKAFLVEAQATLQHARAAIRAAQASDRGDIGKLEIGYMLLASVIGIVPSLIGEFRRQNPSVDVNLHRIEMTEQQKLILEGKLDIGVVKAPSLYPSGIGGFELVSLPYAAILPVGHRLEARKYIRPEELADESFVALSAEAEVSFWRNIALITKERGPRISKRTNDILSLMNLVAAGYGVSIAAHQLRRLSIPGLVFVPLRTAERNSIAVIYRQDDSSSASLALRSFMKARTDLLSL